MYHRLYLLILCAVLVGCTAPSQSPMAGTIPMVADPTAAPTSAQMTMPDITITELAFTGNGNTFLDHIARTIQATGMPNVHRYITIDDNGVMWQGELAAFDEQTLIFLQAAGSGGGSAVQIDAPVSTTIEELTGIALPQPAVLAADSSYPVIEFVRARLTNEGGSESEWSFDVTLRYPDTGWEDYADGWHVETPEGDILGTRILLHPHVNEQPFTRSLGGVTVPAAVTTVIVRSHDLVSGYSPDVVRLSLDGSEESDAYEVIR